MPRQHSFLFLADGFEEIEALSVVDVMRRAGMDVKTVTINPQKEVTGAHGISVLADHTFSDVNFENAEWLILPGGMPGATNLHKYGPLGTLLKAHHAEGGKIAAICAAPAVVLAPLGLLTGLEATCYPGFEKYCVGATMRDVPVMALDKLITANGPAAATRFALAIVANSLGESVAQEVGSGMLYYDKSVSFYF
jgi:4-methyl-5(b-hydroxyethyl)-thiazole monophosphate biosynthesis